MSNKELVDLWELPGNFFGRSQIQGVIVDSKEGLFKVGKVSPDPAPEEPNTNEQYAHCNSCKASFENVEARNAHYKTEWHRVNLKLRSSGLKCISLEEYENLEHNVAQEDESDEESDEEVNSNSAEPEIDSSSLVRNSSPKITFVNTAGQKITVWKELLLPKSYHNEVRQYLDAFIALPKMKQVAIFLCQGGFFAGGIFRDAQCLKHKRIAKYTVRRKNGGSQSSKDASKGGIASAGATIRRQNEVRLREQIHETFADWSQELAACQLTFIVAPSRNKHIFFCDESPFKKTDPKIRSVPFSTERPSFVELKRIHHLLFGIHVGAKVDSKQPEEEKPLAIDEEVNLNLVVNTLHLSSSSISSTPVLHTPDLILESISAGDLMSVKELIFSDYEAPEPVEGLIGKVTPLYLACLLNKQEMIDFLLEVNEDVSERSPKYDFNTPLHLACTENRPHLATLLLNFGANPTIKNMKGSTPFDVCKDADLRMLLRKFAGDNPDLWNYKDAHIPPLTLEMEEEKKRKQNEKNKKKKARQKEKKKQEKEISALEPMVSSLVSPTAKKSLEQVEKEVQKERETQLGKLTQREILSQTADARSEAKKGSGPPCAFCQNPISTIPFERYSYKYCSTKCVVGHMNVLGK